MSLVKKVAFAADFGLVSLYPCVPLSKCIEFLRIELNQLDMVEQTTCIPVFLYQNYAVFQYYGVYPCVLVSLVKNVVASDIFWVCVPVSLCPFVKMQRIF